MQPGKLIEPLRYQQKARIADGQGGHRETFTDPVDISGAARPAGRGDQVSDVVEGGQRRGVIAWVVYLGAVAYVPKRGDLMHVRGQVLEVAKIIRPRNATRTTKVLLWEREGGA